MTEDITTNKGTNSIHENPNLNATAINNLESNVLHSQLNGEITGQSESVTSVSDKKSFHITSVTVQRNSTDGNADESADESRTEDLSDNIDMSTANVQAQTPGFPENIIRKDDVLYKVTSVGSAPIIPTSAQYGIAVVSNPNAEFVENVNKFAADCKLNDLAGRNEFAQNGIEGNCGTALTTKELNAKNERFKVVKIESNEPFRRGRWVCMDFLDQSMDQAKKAATALNETEKSKRKDAEKESEVIVNGAISPETMTTNDVGHKAETEKVSQLGQVAETSGHVNGDTSNSVSPNQTFTAPFVPPANVTQPQAQSLTHIIVPQGTQQPQVASGSYGHSQSLPHSELQHVHQNSQQQPMHVPSSLQQSFHSHSSVQHSQGLMSQGIQHMSTQQQSEPVYSQLPVQQQQTQPLLQQQYQPMQQTSQQRVQSTQPPSSQPQQHSNLHCMPQIPQQQGNQSMPPPQSNTDQLLQQPPSQSVQQPSNQQFQQQNQPPGQQPLQHPMQQVPMQQQTFQHQSGAQNTPQQMIHQSVQQHHSSQQSSQTSVQQMVAPPQTTPATSQQSMQQSNMQQSVLQSSVSHMSAQPAVNQPQSSVQFLPQQPSSLPQPVIQQSTSQQSTQPVLSQPQPQQMMQQPLPGAGDQQLHMQPMQQQQMLPQQMQSQMPQQQQTQQQQPQQQIQQPQQQIPSHQQPIQHIPQQTIPQQQPSQQIQQPQQMQMQQQQQMPQQQGQNQQQIPPPQQQQQQQQHHQQIMQPVPQQQQQPPAQMLQSQMAPAQNMPQANMQHQAAGFQNAQQTQTLPPTGQQQGPQVVQQCVPPPQLAPIPQSLPQQHSIPPPSHQQQQTQTLPQPLQSTQSMQQHTLNQQQLPPPQSINGGQTMQPQYQNVTTQMSDQNIPVSASQPTYQHDVVLPNLAQTDVIMSNQYPLPQQPQTMAAPAQHQLHVSLQQQQQYPNTAPSHYVNSSSMNMVSTSMSSQQTQPQFYSHQVSQSVLPPCSQASCSVASQDIQQLCTHQHQGMSNVTQPPLMSVSSQNLPTSQPTMQNGSQQQQQPPPPQQHSTQSLTAPVGHQNQNLYSVHSQQQQQQNLYPQNSSAVSSQTSAHVQTQTTPNSQPCSTAGVPMQHYTMQPPVPSLAAVPVPPVSTTYVTSIGAVHPSQLSHGYVASLPPTQMYGSGPVPCSMPFVDAASVDYHNQQSSHFPEQVAEYVKNEETSFQRPNEDAESTAGSTNAVAIDNKIEQAMDLVKSHLMFAVREEVEVLKEKIAELMDRINQLEIENSILKANASQDTLAQLPTHQPTTTTATSASSTRPPSGPTSGQPP